VFVLNAANGCIPSDLAAGETEEIEKERRLLYVAMTRAKNELDLIVPQQCTWPVRATATPRAASTGEARIDVAAKLRARWR
jgi:superfamily I DNA/RNA helicase